MKTSLNYWANNYKNIIIADFEQKIENMDYELSVSNLSKEEIVFNFLKTVMTEFQRIGNKIEGFLHYDRISELNTMLMDYALKHYNIDVYELQFDFS